MSAEEDQDQPPPTAPPPLVTRRGALAWVVLAAALFALDGPVGAGVAVLVAAVVLARLPSRLVGLLGVAALALAPIAIVVRGIPSEDEVSPVFVTRSLLPHHLTFAGLVLVSVWVVLDMAPHLVSVARRADGTGGDDGEAGPLVSLPVGIALAAIVAVGMVLACRAVLQA